jgi:hypothetical protein
MPSADFSEFPLDVAIESAVRLPESRTSETSPGNPPTFPPATAPFTLNPSSVDFVIFGSLIQILGLIRGFCPSARGFAVSLPSDPTSR